MFSDGRLLIGKGEKEVYLEPKMANRHGLIAGATGYGKDHNAEGHGGIILGYGRSGISGGYKGRSGAAV